MLYQGYLSDKPKECGLPDCMCPGSGPYCPCQMHKMGLVDRDGGSAESTHGSESGLSVKHHIEEGKYF